MRSWVLLLYKVPPEPTARRVYVWRKLKRLGALLLHDAAWVLPATDDTLEQFRWLAAEIHELDGSAMVWMGQLALDGQDDDLIARFRAQAERTYGDILRDLERPGSDVAALSRRFVQAQRQDYFHPPLCERVREALERARGEGGA